MRQSGFPMLNSGYIDLTEPGAHGIRSHMQQRL